MRLQYVCALSKGSKMYLSYALSRLSAHNTKQGKQTEIKVLTFPIHDMETDVKDSTLTGFTVTPRRTQLAAWW